MAINAQLNGVIDVCCDAGGNVYIADQWNGAVRRVDAITGKIYTYAGKGTLGYSGDGGLAVNAELNEPGGLFVDKFNNLFISDYRNGAIRRVDGTTKRIITVAGGAAGYGGDGGPATAAKLKCTDVLVHENGSLYIADYVNHRIRRVNNAVGIVAPAVAVGLGIYPNPNTGKFRIDAVEGETVTVCSLSGEKVLELLPATPQPELDITAQPPGVYLVYVHGSDGVRMGRVVKE